MNSCKDNGTGPTRKPFKNPREMTWTADTLKMPDYAIQLLPRDLLVVSPENIWLAAWVGHGQVFHYDGKSWEMVKEVGGGINCLVQGNTPNSIWAGGYIGRDVNGQFTQNAYLGYYNGTSWQDNEFQLKSELLDISKDTGGNIWACGRNGLVMKYENNKWIADTIKIGYKQTYPEVEYFLRSIEEYDYRQSVIAWIGDIDRKRNIYYYITGQIDNWSIVDSIVSELPIDVIRFGNFGVYPISNKKLYSYGSLGIWELRNAAWVKIYDFNSSIYDMYGASENYLLTVGAFRAVVFYEGASWERIENLLNVEDPYFSFTNVWTDGYGIIISGYGTVNDRQGTIIWYGK